MTNLTPRVTAADTLREIESVLDEFIDEKGIVVKFPGTVQQKVIAVLETWDDNEEFIYECAKEIERLRHKWEGIPK